MIPLAFELLVLALCQNGDTSEKIEEFARNEFTDALVVQYGIQPLINLPGTEAADAGLAGPPTSNEATRPMLNSETMILFINSSLAHAVGNITLSRSSSSRCHSLYKFMGANEALTLTIFGLETGPANLAFRTYIHNPRTRCVMPHNS